MEKCKEKNLLVDNKVFEFWKDYEMMMNPNNTEPIPILSQK